VGERTGIYHDRHGTLACAVHRFDEVAFEVRLHVSNAETGVTRELRKALDVLGQRVVP